MLTSTISNVMTIFQNLLIFVVFKNISLNLLFDETVLTVGVNKMNCDEGFFKALCLTSSFTFRLNDFFFSKNLDCAGNDIYIIS